jgi:hypothetical protein
MRHHPLEPRVRRVATEAAPYDADLVGRDDDEAEPPGETTVGIEDRSAVDRAGRQQHQEQQHENRRHVSPLPPSFFRRSA